MELQIIRFRLVNYIICNSCGKLTYRNSNLNRIFTVRTMFLNNYLCKNINNMFFYIAIYVCGQLCVTYKHLCNAQRFRFVPIKGVINYMIAHSN